MYEADFRVEQELSLTPQIPAFFLDGDRAEIGVLVNSTTKKEEEIEISLKTSEGTLSSSTKKITVSPGTTQLVSFDIAFDLQATLPQNITFTWTARGKSFSDAVEVQKILYPSKSQEYVFTTGDTDELSYEEKLDFSRVQNF